LAAILTYRINDGQNAMVLPALAVALASGAAVGLMNGIGVALLRVPPLVMTLGMAGVVQGLILSITQGNMVGDTAPVMSTYISRPLVLGIPGVVFIWLLLATLMWLLLERSRYGKQLFAIGVNRTTARLSGVRVPQMVILTYTLSSLLAAFGGFVLLGFTEVVFLNLGGPYLFPSVAAVVVGGTAIAGGKGSYFGTMAGALVLTLISSLLTALQMEDAFRQIILGVTLLVLISLYGRQRGLRQ
jgi:ribose transport system permease protein